VLEGSVNPVIAVPVTVIQEVVPVIEFSPDIWVPPKVSGPEWHVLPTA